MRITPGGTERGAAAMQYNAVARERYELIRADKMLTDEGKQVQLARAWWEAKRAIKTLEADEMSARASRRRSLTDSLFKPSASLNSTDIIATRDASDRVARVESAEEAERLMKSALYNDDERLVKALGRRCLDEGWTAPLQEWSDSRPHAGIEDKINELMTIESAANSLEHAIQGSWDFTCDKPHEIERMRRPDLDAVVGADTLALEAVGDMGVRTQGGMSDRRADYALPTDQRQTASQLAVSFGQVMGGQSA